MELVGKAVRKCFLGLESTPGVVKSYDASTGYFNIQYDNGASEEVGLDQITSILKETDQRPPTAPISYRRCRGRPPKKRLRFDFSGQHVVYGIFADATTNALRAGNGGLGGLSQTTELRTNSAGVADRGMGKSLVDHSNESERLCGLDVVGACMEEVLPDYCSPVENHDEDLGGEGVLVDLDMKDKESMRQRRKLSGQPSPFLDMPLRRSARRASNTPISPPDTLVYNNVSVIQNGDSKPALPCSSGDMDVDGLPVLDLFSVYSCLRSFARSLFLSPFGLETFVAALRCKYANRLIDSLHFSLLQAIKPHLKLLMEEEFQPATDCLRNLNWDFLDLLTWPLFLVEYMLLCGSAMRFDFKRAQLDLLSVEYYEQPAEVKLKILRCLCDDVIEVESLRSELNRRVTDEFILDPNNITNSLRRRKCLSTYDGESSITPHEIADIADIADGNSDECCLCRMDGNLICCDGCPAAFHSRCVGVVKDLLPEGEWYCPECLVVKDRVVSFLMPFKGADFLGRDSHGRLFYGCCGYLLVSDSCDSNPLCRYYNKNDILSVINILKSEPSPFNEIRYAISAYWGISINDTSSDGQYENDVHSPKEILDGKMFVKSGSSSAAINVCDNFTLVRGRCNVPICASSEKSDITDSIQPSSAISIELEEMPSLPTVSEPVCNKLNVTSLGHSSINDFDVCSHPAEFVILKPSEQIMVKDEYFEFPGRSYASEKKIVASQLHSDPFNYVNYYSFGQVAAAMAEELLPKPSDVNIKDSLRSDEVMKSDQLKTICKKFTQWCWCSYYNLMMHIQKEDCGWCFTCRRLSDDECLFKSVDEKFLERIKINLEGLNNCTRLDFENNNKGHIVFAMHYILSIEDRVRSLLTGPWEKLYYHEQWQRAVLKAYDITTFKLLLLSLESNLRRVALLSEWMKPVDTDQNCGFTSSNLTGFHWWRGGKLSRQLFCWRMLPRSLVSKCSRQAGYKKIPNLFYHDGSEFSKRSKGISWQVAVEMCENVAQLIYLVKDLDSNIKWAEISSTHVFPQCTKESKKIEKLFKQVLVRKKCIQGTEVKYLLDFGKREIIPAIVTKYGVLLEECSDNRKRFWLGENHVPLNLVRAFEDKKLSRLSKKKDSGQACKKQCIVTMKKSKKSKGFTYLFSRVRNSEKHRCGHCNEDVLLREAVNCQYCDVLFHRKHFRVPKGAIVTTYTCFKCENRETPNAKPKADKIVGRKRKASIFRKGNTTSISVKWMENPDSLCEKLKDPTVLFANKSKVNRHFKSKTGSLVRKLNEKHLSSAKKSNEKLVSLVRRSTENLVAVQCRKNPVRMARKLKQTTISIDNKSKLIRKKRKHVMKRKKKIVEKLGRNLQSKKVESLRSDNYISWSKKKRSVLHRSYWLNGMLWLNDPTNERGRCFRERKVFLPMQPAQVVSPKPMCCLCRGDYNAGLIFVCCEGCGDWFHGEALGLEVESISNLAGFKCPKCRMKNVPACPFSKI